MNRILVRNDIIIRLWQIGVFMGYFIISPVVGTRLYILGVVLLGTPFKTGKNVSWISGVFSENFAVVAYFPLLLAMLLNFVLLRRL